jgi:hypothetical protein
MAVVPTAVVVLLAAWTAYRVAEVVSVRTRLILYDRRMLAWRHASYARSLILLVFNFAEVIALYGIIYGLLWALAGQARPPAIDLFMFSAAGFFGQTVYHLTAPSSRLLELARLSEIWLAFFLITVGLGALVNMMGEGKEVHTKHIT